MRVVVETDTEAQTRIAVEVDEVNVRIGREIAAVEHVVKLPDAPDSAAELLKDKLYCCPTVGCKNMRKMKIYQFETFGALLRF